MRLTTFLVLLLTVGLVCRPTDGGLVGIAAYGLCQTGCNTAAVACYAAAGGAVFGVVLVPACSAAQGACMAACAAMALAPTP